MLNGGRGAAVELSGVSRWSMLEAPGQRFDSLSVYLSCHSSPKNKGHWSQK